MLFYSGLAMVIIIIVFFLVTLRLLFLSRMRMNSAWDELMELWKKRYEMLTDYVEYTKSDIKDKKLFHFVLHSRNECYLATNHIDLAKANLVLTVEFDKLLLAAGMLGIYEGDTEYDAIHSGIVAIEEKILFTLSFYEEYTAKYNKLVHRLPTNAVAGLCGFRARKPIE